MDDCRVANANVPFIKLSHVTQPDTNFVLLLFLLFKLPLTSLLISNDVNVRHRQLVHILPLPREAHFEVIELMNGIFANACNH